MEGPSSPSLVTPKEGEMERDSEIEERDGCRGSLAAVPAPSTTGCRRGERAPSTTGCRRGERERDVTRGGGRTRHRRRPRRRHAEKGRAWNGGDEYDKEERERRKRERARREPHRRAPPLPKPPWPPPSSTPPLLQPSTVEERETVVASSLRRCSARFRCPLALPPTSLAPPPSQLQVSPSPSMEEAPSKFTATVGAHSMTLTGVGGENTKPSHH